VKIMKTHDPRGIDGPKAPLPDVVVVHTPKDDEFGFVAGGGKEGDKVGHLPHGLCSPICHAYADVLQGLGCVLHGLSSRLSKRLHL
jgi:hypothetical protein